MKLIEIARKPLAAMRSHSLWRGACSASMAVLLAFSLNASPFAVSVAEADTIHDIINSEADLEKLLDELDMAQDAYNGAQDRQNEAAAKAAENQKTIDEINARLAPHRTQLEEILTWEYKNGTDAIIDVLSGAESVSNFFVKMDYVSHIEKTKVDTMKVIAEGQAELIAENKELERQQQAEEDAKAEQQEIMDAAQVKIDELNAYIDSLREDQKEELIYKGQHGGGPAYDPPEGCSVVDAALSRVGCPYVWGASGSNSFDCSGLVMWAYKVARGVSLPHQSESQRACGYAIPVSEARAGDILWRPGHVGIALGDGTYVHAPHSGAYVSIAENINQFSCAVRID